MNRKEFFMRLVAKYPNFFNSDDKANAWLDDYKIALPSEKFDYEKLKKQKLKLKKFKARREDNNDNYSSTS